MKITVRTEREQENKKGKEESVEIKNVKWGKLKEKDLINDSKEKGTIEMINSSNKQELIDLSWKLIEM